jgi:hypothetical protein
LHLRAGIAEDLGPLGLPRVDDEALRLVPSSYRPCLRRRRLRVALRRKACAAVCTDTVGFNRASTASTTSEGLALLDGQRRR